MNSQIGVHAAVWSGGWSDAESRHAIAESKAAEYDYIEIMAFDPASIDVDANARAAGRRRARCDEFARAELGQ